MASDQRWRLLVFGGATSALVAFLITNFAIGEESRVYDCVGHAGDYGSLFDATLGRTEIKEGLTVLERVDSLLNFSHAIVGTAAIFITLAAVCTMGRFASRVGGEANAVAAQIGDLRGFLFAGAATLALGIVTTNAFMIWPEIYLPEG